MEEASTTAGDRFEAEFHSPALSRQVYTEYMWYRRSCWLIGSVLREWPVGTSCSAPRRGRRAAHPRRTDRLVKLVAARLSFARGAAGGQSCSPCG
jgi:hypothetical protein